MSEMRPQPFEIHVPDEALDDLHHRLARITWPDEIAGSGWDYGAPLAFMRDLRWPKPGDQTPVPLGVAMTATHRFEQPPREYVARMFPDIRRRVQLPRGGHYVAMEEPDLLAEQIRAFFRPLR